MTSGSPQSNSARLPRLAKSITAATVILLFVSSCGSGVDSADQAARTTASADTNTSTTTPSDATTTTGDASSGTTTTTELTTPEESTTTSTASTAQPGSAEFPEDWSPKPLEWSDCGNLECADLAVPLDWSDPGGSTLTLALNRRPATGTATGSLLTNPGGPGASGMEFVSSGIFSDAVFDPLREKFNIIGWDPRGTGQSQAVDCGSGSTDFLHLDSAPDNDAEQAELDDAAAKVATACGETSGDILAHISTDDSVNDIEAIRRAVGDDALTFYGFSYGTALGSEYADRFPDKVRAIVLDGVVDPSSDLEAFLAAQTAAFDRQVDSIFSNCGGIDSCPVSDPASLYDEVAEQLEKTPLTAGGSTLGPAELAVAAVAVTYVSGSERDFIPALKSAKDGDAQPLLELADMYYSAADFDPYLAIECVDQPHPIGDAEWEAFSDRLEAISPRLGGSVANELLPCATWPVPVQRVPKMPTAKGSAPILVIGNTGDAATPIEQAEKMAKSLDNAVLVTSDDLGHTSYGIPCIDKISVAYLVDGTLPSAGTTC